MLEKPDIKDQHILDVVSRAYGIAAVTAAFLPLGADVNTAVYRIVTQNRQTYFLKLRRGAFDEFSVTLPKWLADQGAAQIIPPLTTTTGRLWATFDPFTMILYPFVEGHNGYESSLSEQHWREFGAALKRIHTSTPPAAIWDSIQQERYDPQWRESVVSFLERAERDIFDEPIAAQVAALLRKQREQIHDLVERAERYAQLLGAQTPALVVCHSDLHAGNFLITPSSAFYIVDWDAPILAPKERDLMFIGGGLAASGRTPQEEEHFFYAGYGETQIDRRALAYYRYERIIQDIAAFCEQLLLTNDGGEDRPLALRYLASNFLSDGTIELARLTDPD